MDCRKCDEFPCGNMIDVTKVGDLIKGKREYIQGIGCLKKTNISKDKMLVDHPKHYNRAIECIDEMIAVFGVEVVKHFCLCNVWKYRYRASDKNGQEDLDKSDWYMKKYMELSGEPVKTKSVEITDIENIVR